ncbi:cation:proton antiporter [Klebsiella aerogenes]|jgi:NhaP-type Na+/H+ or K+/H+ antiporter|uniref:cation:proton antiporter n=1 Tax=Klebsiella aerogenes TaxID=548 RepID=UPI00063C29C1|nr:sodium:proton antiporter [Klebsiella aerogenes]EKV7122085.1 sodium:proton antiporter [Klebsiella aerogenes]EKZ9892569.1 sodium:proton antiporter [Klebsiella aerogenes]KAA0465669.1 sodium:proton antiporter [Klebsiella aerogenes]KLE79156.1 sodium:proton exchanger [Klebsiella aerogenes]KTJ05500.1 sodium:proton exchanger [Klebsiella aerogenes]
MELSVPFMLVIISIASLLAQWLAWRLRIPSILPLLLIGVLLGPGVHLLQPDILFGPLLFPLVSLSVAIILFEGALTLRFDEIRGLGGIVRNLVTVGMLITFAVISLTCWGILGLTPQISALIGAVTVVTGPTVISPLMRVVRPTASINQVLRWEGIVIDPVGAIFTLLVFEFITLQEQTGTWLHLLIMLTKTVVIGLVSGAVFGVFLGNALRRGWIPGYLQNFAVLSFVLLTFGVSNTLADESGLLAVTVLGIWLANMREVETSDIVEFKEELSAILLSALFIILAARLDIHALWAMGWPLLILMLIVQFVARPLCILVSTWRSSLHWRDRLMLCWIAPRGIVAAAVSSLFALTLQKKGYENADQLVTVVFAIIIGTVVLQSLTSSQLARWLGVQQRRPRGVLIVGANTVARTLAQALRKLDIPVQLSDNSWEYYRLARMEGLPTYYGNVWSEHAENYLNLSEIRQVIALSPNRHQNALTTLHFQHIFGNNRVFSIRTGPVTKGRSEKETRHEQLFDTDMTWARLSSLIAKGAVMKVTRLNNNFGWPEYLSTNPGATPLFAQREDGNLIAINNGIMPPPPCTIVAIIEPGVESEKTPSEAY